MTQCAVDRLDWFAKTNSPMSPTFIILAFECINVRIVASKVYIIDLLIPRARGGSSALVGEEPATITTDY